MESGIHFSPQSNCHHHNVFANFNLKIVCITFMDEKLGIRERQKLTLFPDVSVSSLCIMDFLIADVNPKLYLVSQTIEKFSLTLCCMKLSFATIEISNELITE